MVVLLPLQNGTGKHAASALNHCNDSKVRWTSRLFKQTVILCFCTSLR